MYEEFGVKEYWIVSLKNQTILLYTLNEMGRYEPSKVFALGEEAGSSVLPEFVLRLDDVFED